jgi:hypothetical protein
VDTDVATDMDMDMDTKMDTDMYIDMNMDTDTGHAHCYHNLESHHQANFEIGVSSQML